MVVGGYVLEFVFVVVLFFFGSLSHEEEKMVTGVHWDRQMKFNGVSWFWIPTGRMTENMGCGFVVFGLVLYCVASRWFIGNAAMNGFFTAIFGFLWHLVF